MILSEQREGSGEDPDRGLSSNAHLGPCEGDADSGLRRPTPNRLRGKRVWKAYHERPVLLAKDRQRSRAVCGESGDGHRRLPGPAEVPRDFASQLKRLKEYKRRCPPSGRSNRCPDRPGTTRTRLSFRFDAEAPATKLPRQTPLPPPPPPPPPPSRALNPSRHPSSPAALFRRPLKPRAIAIPNTRSRRR